MNKEKSLPIESEEILSQAQQMFYERENQCPLCCEELLIRVRSYLENFTIAEEALCPKCDLVVRTKDHKMN